MIIPEIREQLARMEDDIVVFGNPSFDNSIIGIAFDNRVIYPYEKMIMELVEDDLIDPLDAEEFIQYNTLRTIPYMGDKAPIIEFEIY